MPQFIFPIELQNVSSILPLTIVTHISPASLFPVIGKQDSPRCDAVERGVPSAAILFA